MPRTRWSSTRSRRRRPGTQNLLDRDAVPARMDEAIPGSRVRATTKHGTLTVDELAAMQPGMARLMDELSRRYWVLYYAAKAGNWELAGYMERESEKILRTAAVARPKYREDIAAFLRNRFGPVASAIEAEDWRGVEGAYRCGMEGSGMY